MLFERKNNYYRYRFNSCCHISDIYSRCRTLFNRLLCHDLNFWERFIQSCKNSCVDDCLSYSASGTLIPPRAARAREELALEKIRSVGCTINFVEPQLPHPYPAAVVDLDPVAVHWALGGTNLNLLHPKPLSRNG